jgi:hypothetical protein
MKKCECPVVYIGKNNFPVEGIINRPIKTFIRRLILTKRKMRYCEWLDAGGCRINFDCDAIN